MSTKRMKKMTAIVLALILSVAMLAGCVANDIGYWNLLTESKKVEGCTVSGDFTIEVNPEFFGVFGMEPVNIKLQITGGVIQKDSGVYTDLTIKYGINDPKMPQTLNILIDDKAMYIPVKDFIDVVFFGLKYREGMGDKMCNDVKAALEKEFSENDYLLVTDVNIKTAFKNLNKVIDSLKKMFSGLDSGMTKKIDNGYALEINYDNLTAFADRLVDHISKNKKTIHKEVINILKAMEGFDAWDESMKEIFGALAAELEKAEKDFYDALDFVTEFYNKMSDVEKEEFALNPKGSYLKHTITKSGGAYTDNIDARIISEGEKILSVKGKLTATPATLEEKTVDAQDPIDMEGLNETIDKVMKRVNHAKEITIMWYNESDYVFMSIERVEGSDYDSAQSNIENGTMFLPMRQICEWFGEEVFWDSKERKAYIIRGEARIEMTGKIVDGRTLVKIRDFEKLGYTVDYEYDKEWKEHKVVIKK